MDVRRNAPAPAVPSTSVFRADVMKDKVLFVTGGGSGIGLEIAKTFAAHGAKVGICGRTAAKLAAAADQIRAAGASEVVTATADVRSEDAMKAAMATVGERFGRIDVLVNNAAGNFMCAAEDLSAKALQTVLNIDLMGAFNSSKAALPWLSRAAGGSCIINISATLQYSAFPFQSHAAAAKAGIDVLTNTLGCEWAEYGVRVVGIAPGAVAGTEGGPTGRVFGGLGGGAKNPSATCPVGRFGETADIANTALFLASPAATWITSTTVVVDGAMWHAMGAGPILTNKQALRGMLQKQKMAHSEKKRGQKVAAKL